MYVCMYVCMCTYIYTSVSQILKLPETFNSETNKIYFTIECFT